jgi:hypothetical protein
MSRRHPTRPEPTPLTDLPTDLSSAVHNAHVAQALAFATTPRRLRSADPSDVAHQLRRGTAAFLRRDYATAHPIFAALLNPIGDRTIDIGLDQLDDVSRLEISACAARYVVSAYMLAPAADRAAALRAAIDPVQTVGFFWEPLRELERIAVEPLPGLAAFLPQWRALLEAEVTRKAAGIRSHHWLREVVLRIDGLQGLATLARTSRRVDDLLAWCQRLVDAHDWHAARKAFIAAADLVADKDEARGDFFERAALAAQQLGRSDLPAHLERAWRAGPNIWRLRRWLGSSTTRAALGKRVETALAACPKHAADQRALLLVLSHDVLRAAKLLAAAPGIGWTNSEHPGHLLFSIFTRLLGAPWDADLEDVEAMRRELDAMAADPEHPDLATPEVEALIDRARITNITGAAREAVLAAMRRAAERRVAAVVEHGQRGYSVGAARLVAACVACDDTPVSARWAAALRAQYKRHTALRHALDRAAKSR